MESPLSVSYQRDIKRLFQVHKAQSTSLRALSITEDAAASAANAKNVSHELKAELDKLLDEIKDFTAGDRAKPSEIRKLAEEVMNKTISLSQDEVMQLALQINQTVLGLTNIDAIIKETARDAALAESTKQRAEDAR